VRRLHAALIEAPLLVWAVLGAPSPGRLPTVLAASVSPPFVITNGQPRSTVDGKVIDAHDGEIVKFGGTYYLYGSAYACGFRLADPSSPFCGFNVYSSPDLASWTGPTVLLDPSAYWQDLCMHGSAPGGGCFRPHIRFNQQTQLYVLWVKVPGGYRALTSLRPDGPFAVSASLPISGGDMALFADTDGTGYLVYTSAGRIFEYRLTRDYLNVTGASQEVTGFPQVAPFYGAEAPSMFARNNQYYLVLSVPQCPYCYGTGSGYFTAPTPFGPWSYQGLISDWSCDGQPAAVSQLDDTYLYQSDQWLQTPNEYAAHQFWEPLRFDGAKILPLKCVVGSYPNLSYLPWYDNASPGFAADNIHIVNPISSGQFAVGAVALPGQQLSFSIPPGQEWYGHFFPGTATGPVVIGSNVPVIAAQRAQYFQSFNEVPAQRSGAATDLYFSWFDRISSPGFRSDNIHVVNPSATTVTVTVTIPGQPGCSPTQAIAAGEAAVFSCASGFGGPVHVQASQPVLASQRMVYFQTFNEVNGQPATGATALFSTWYDHASSALFAADNVHVVAPSGSLAAANVNVSIPGCSIANVWRYSDSEWIYNCPFGQGFGGPVQVTATTPVLVSQRVQYGDSFNEVAAQDAQQAATILSMPWFDHSSSVGFMADNVHVTSPSGSLHADQVRLTIPGCSPAVWQASPSELVYSCQFGHGFGGPVVISATIPVLASQRVQYYRSFNEVAAHS
jgi:Glycosyl hydrolases family 43